MTERQGKRLEQRRARYEAMLGEYVAALIEGDTAVVTARLSKRDRSIALRYREVVQQLAGC